MRIGGLIRRWRITQDIGIRDAAKEIGLSPATLSRVERGHMPDGASVIKLLLWLFGEPDKEVAGGPRGDEGRPGADPRRASEPDRAGL